MHLGPCNIFGLNITKDQLISYIQKYNIVASIVQPFPGAPNAIQIHNEIYELSRELSGKIYGMACINPYIGREKVSRELERVLKELKFVGIKINTAGHAVSPMNPHTDVIFEYAAKYRVPVMIHTGPGPFSDPMSIVPRVEEYTEVKIILAHAGSGIYGLGALWLAKKYDNVYLEHSWVPIHDLKLFIDQVPNKVMFGTDLIENVPIELAKIEALKPPDNIKESILYKNAKKVFELPI